MKRLASVLGAAALVLTIVPSTFAASAPTQNIAQVAAANGNFKTLVAAVGCADPAIARALTGKGMLTVFAPTDDAFGKLGLNPTNICTSFTKAKLTKILEYHVVAGAIPAAKALPKTWARIGVIKTLDGQDIAVTHNGTIFTTTGGVSHVMVKAKLFDIMASNGIIHVVDAVLVPTA